MDKQQSTENGNSGFGDGAKLSIIELQLAHARMVNALAKPGEDIQDSLTPVKIDAMHHAIGISGEAGELLDAIKKFVIYNKPLDRDNVIEELGDLEFYMQGIRQNLGISRSKTLRHNMEKLAVRYKEFKYSDEQAHARNDKESGK